jgi:two-component system, OmpR family, phosphate regulon sensor histidine kinase PhoR
MTKNKIRLIIGLMSVALLALLFFQLYWIGFTVRAENEQFGATVRDALQEVARNLERQEIYFLTQKKIEADSQQKRLLAIAQKKTKKVKTPDLQKPIESPAPSSNMPSLVGIQAGSHSLPTDFLVPQGEVTVQLTLPDIDPALMTPQELAKRIEAERHFEQLVNNVFEHQVNLMRRQDSLMNIAQFANIPINAQRSDSERKAIRKARNEIKVQKLQQTEDKATLFKDVLEEFFLKDRNVLERINRQVLDSLLRFAVHARGINIPFEYGVILKDQPDRLHFSNVSLGRESAIRTGGYRTSLFSSDLRGESAFLTVFFPNKDTFIVRNLWWVYACSVLLFLTFIGCFYVAINTILKQKKLADIKNDFINNMTHEFKTPISTISLACQMLADDVVSTQPSVFKRYLGIIRDENRRLGTQVEKVLQTALLDRGEVRLKLGTVNLHEIIEKVTSTIAPQIEMREGQITLHLNAQNPEIEADEIHLTNVVYNLLDNANKYSPDAPDIVIETQDTESMMAFSIADRGLGMEKEALKNIFEKFYRIPTGNLHDVKGFGLGLSYVKKIVEEHQGQVAVESTVGQGSRFEIRLPKAV